MPNKSTDGTEGPDVFREVVDLVTPHLDKVCRHCLVKDVLHAASACAVVEMCEDQFMELANEAYFDMAGDMKDKTGQDAPDNPEEPMKTGDPVVDCASSLIPAVNDITADDKPEVVSEALVRCIVNLALHNNLSRDQIELMFRRQWKDMIVLHARGHGREE